MMMTFGIMDFVTPKKQVVTLKGQGVTLPHYRDLWAKCIELDSPQR